MKNKTRFMIKPVVIALAVAFTASTFASAVDATEKTYTEVGSVTYNGWGDSAMAHIAVTSGRALIDHLMTVKALLDTGQYDQARSALVASKEFADAIQRIMPYFTVAEELRNTSDKLVEKNVDVLRTDLLPIYSSLDELAVFAPEGAQKSTDMVKQAQKHAEAGDTARAAKELQAAAAEVEQHTVYLPVDYVDQQVRSAQQALDQKQPDVMTAKTAVEQAVHSLILVVDTVEQTTSS